ncbi:jg1492, partial [Pararge aegeria aegeria]
MQHVNNGNDVVIAGGIFSPRTANFLPGWQIFQLRVSGSGSFIGYVRIWGRDPGSVAVVDSYRYIGP